MTYAPSFRQHFPLKSALSQCNPRECQAEVTPPFSEEEGRNNCRRDKVGSESSVSLFRLLTPPQSPTAVKAENVRSPVGTRKWYAAGVHLEPLIQPRGTIFKAVCWNFLIDVRETPGFASTVN